MWRFKKLITLFLLTLIVTVTINISYANAYDLNIYTVKSGDSLWKISSITGVSINDLKLINDISTEVINVGQLLKLKPDTHFYTVKSGDSLWYISNKFGITIVNLKSLNGLINDSIFIGQSLKIMPDTINYIVKPSDMLYTIALKYNTTVNDIKNINKLTSDVIYVDQTLLIPYKLQQTTVQTPSPAPTSTPSPSPAPTATPNPVPAPSKPTPVLSWPSITYIVQAGDNVSLISRKFGVPSNDIMKYNYMTDADWFNAGEKIAINGYAPRNYAVFPNQDSARTKYGKQVDWFLDGKYILRRNSILTITDLQTGKVFSAKVMGGYNHADIEPLTINDTNVMKQLWYEWNWTPRPVVIFKDGMNIAASLSGMPHSFDTTPENGVTGHFDIYLLNSIPHGAETSKIYVEQHYANVYKSAGIQK